MNLQIIYEDNDVLAIDKPSGLTVNRSETTVGQITVQDFAEEKLQISKIKKEPVDTQGSIDTIDAFYNRSGIVHRLDKETSGILLVAKNPFAFFHLLKQFRERTIHKSYVALAHGIVKPPEDEIKVPVGRLTWNRKRFGVIAGGRDSITKYKTINTYSDSKRDKYSLLELFPETGRTHQIRVHLKYINHPIVSDALYGGRKTARNDRKKLLRLFLHAAKISFHHPISDSELSLESKLPRDLQSFVETLTIVESS